MVSSTQGSTIVGECHSGSSRIKECVVVCCHRPGSVQVGAWGGVVAVKGKGGAEGGVTAGGAGGAGSRTAAATPEEVPAKKQ